MFYNLKLKNIARGEKSGRSKKITWFVLIIILMSLSFATGTYSAQKNEVVKKMAEKEVVYLGQLTEKYSKARGGVLTQDISFDLFWDVWDELEKEYVDKDKLNEKEMFYGAIKGMVASIGDPYTVFMDPKLTIEFENDLAGTFEGIGAEIGIRKEVLTIIAPLKGTPAEKSGLKAGDQIYYINGESTAGISVDEAVNKIRGPKETTVTLTILREGSAVAKDIIITRGVIVVESVKTETISSAGGSGETKDEKKIDDDIFVITISNFNNDTLQLFNSAVSQLLVKNPKGIVLDLRNNPGGYLETAIEMASEWVDGGLVVTEKFSDTKKNEYLSRGRARLKDYPTVVLVNKGSASASEIVAGALRDHKKGTIIGEQTFGKGSVQTLKELSDGSTVKVTVAKWLTPNGDSINEAGIKPDIEVAITPKDYEENKDPQMDRAIEVLKK